MLIIAFDHGTGGSKTIEIPENKDYVYFNGTRFYSSLNIFSADTFFVSQAVVDLLS